jgi:Na+-transporting methylmalonyl-CoA/oxaloacetate decarboxylase gamma subunit
MSGISIALQITVLGMGLVFAAIILLWGMMALLTKIAAGKETQEIASQSPNTRREEDLKAQAAAIAVAMALAEQQASQAHPLSLPPTAIISAWQLGMRTRQMYQKGTPIVRNPRKIG